MIKETVICIIIVIGIIGLELLTQNFTEKTVKEIRETFSKIENEIVKQWNTPRRARGYALP